eukprot:scaffold135370_cov35-Prasinocladus_malaysianus.AAC.1
MIHDWHASHRHRAALSGVSNSNSDEGQPCSDGVDLTCWPMSTQDTPSLRGSYQSSTESYEHSFSESPSRATEANRKEAATQRPPGCSDCQTLRASSGQLDSPGRVEESPPQVRPTHSQWDTSSLRSFSATETAMENCQSFPGGQQAADVPMEESLCSPFELAQSDHGPSSSPSHSVDSKLQLNGFDRFMEPSASSSRSLFLPFPQPPKTALPDWVTLKSPITSSMEIPLFDRDGGRAEPLLSPFEMALPHSPVPTSHSPLTNKPAKLRDNSSGTATLQYSPRGSAASSSECLADMEIEPVFSPVRQLTDRTASNDITMVPTVTSEELEVKRVLGSGSFGS